MDPKDEPDADRQCDVEEEIQEEKGARERLVTDKGPTDGLGKDGQGIQQAGAFQGEELRLFVPDHDVTGPTAHEEEEEQEPAGHPREPLRSPTAALDQHPKGVDHGGHNGQVGGVAVEAAHPTARPDLTVDPPERFVGTPDAIEKQQVESRDQHDAKRRHRQRSRLIKRIEPPRIQPVERGVGGGQRAAAGGERAEQHGGRHDVAKHHINMIN